jgi:cell division protease FtsH
VLYALLLKLVPLEVKINVASFDGGYNSFLPLRAKSRQDMLDMICVGLGGRAAETLVFGPNACTTGAEEDLRQATVDASQFVRVHGFSGRLTRVDVGCEIDCEVNTAIDETNAPMEAIVAAQFNRALALLQQHARELADIAELLMKHGEIPRPQLAEIFRLQLTEEPAVLAPYAQQLEAFAERLKVVTSPQLENLV